MGFRAWFSRLCRSPIRRFLAIHLVRDDILKAQVGIQDEVYLLKKQITAEFQAHHRKLDLLLAMFGKDDDSDKEPLTRQDVRPGDPHGL